MDTGLFQLIRIHPCKSIFNCLEGFLGSVPRVLLGYLIVLGG